MIDDIKFIEVKDVAKVLGVHPQTVCRYIREGKLKAIKVGLRLYKVSEYDFKEYLNGLKYQPVEKKINNN